MQTQQALVKTDVDIHHQEKITGPNALTPTLSGSSVSVMGNCAEMFWIEG